MAVGKLNLHHNFLAAATGFSDTKYKFPALNPRKVHFYLFIYITLRNIAKS